MCDTISIQEMTEALDKEIASRDDVGEQDALLNGVESERLSAFVKRIR